jgi:hypothetical protein
LAQPFVKRLYMVSTNISLCQFVEDLNSIVEKNPEILQQYPIFKQFNKSPGPDPPRLWTRSTTDCVNCQNNYCSEIGIPTDYPPPVCNCDPNAIYITPEQFDMRRKAEIFLYKKNANDQTKKEKYALLAKGINIYKKISWATQSQYYTNPNVNGLPQVGYTLTCGNVNNLQNCSPTTNNDVPGPIMNICYDQTIPLTNYVTRRIYTFNGTKWPQTAWKPGNNGFPVGKAGRFLM